MLNSAFPNLLLAAIAVSGISIFAGCQSETDRIVAQVKKELEKEKAEKAANEKEQQEEQTKPDPNVQLVPVPETFAARVMVPFKEIDLSNEQLESARLAMMKRGSEVAELTRTRISLLPQEISERRTKAIEEATKAGKSGANLDAAVVEAIGMELYNKLSAIDAKQDEIIRQLQEEIRKSLTAAQLSELDSDS